MAAHLARHLVDCPTHPALAAITEQARADRLELSLDYATTEAARWKQEVERMQAPQEPTFQRGEHVRVNHPRYHGEGIVQYDSGARSRMIGVRLCNDNVWEYEVETVTRIEGDANASKD